MAIAINISNLIKTYLCFHMHIIFLGRQKVSNPNQSGIVFWTFLELIMNLYTFMIGET
jgi:hypothetical protein